MQAQYNYHECRGQFGISLRAFEYENFRKVSFLLLTNSIDDVDIIFNLKVSRYLQLKLISLVKRSFGSLPYVTFKFMS